MHGYCLQQVGGRADIPFDGRRHAKEIDGSNNVVPLVDRIVNVKMNYTGPDIGYAP